jgi:cysteine-rich repeat protein
MSSPSRPLRTALCCLGLLLAVAACGGGSQDLTQCGNGRIDTGEQCDDGNTIDDDNCTAICQNPRCGDGAVRAGVETCDGGNVGTQTCGALGYDPGPGGVAQPNCLASCDGYDVSLCGAQFTPTPVIPTATVTATPTSTPSATPTPTLPPASCGNGLLQPGETCASCPQDCQVAACAPSGTTFTFNLALAGSRQPTDTAVRLAYRSGVISIPGSGSDVTVRQRVRFAPPPPTTFLVDDLNYAVDISSVRPGGLPTAPAPFATARFDGCTGAPTPTVDDLSCVVVRCTDATGAIAGCACVVTAQP